MLGAFEAGIKQAVEDADMALRIRYRRLLL